MAVRLVAAGRVAAAPHHGEAHRASPRSPRRVACPSRSRRGADVASAGMDIWAVIAEERTSLIETFEGLRDGQWDTPSLCGHWTVRQVLGHLVIATDPPGGRFAREVLKAFGSFDKANDRLALEQADRPIAELLADLRAGVEAFTPPGLGPEAPLHDILLHSLDVRIPLGLPSRDRPRALRPRPRHRLQHLGRARSCRRVARRSAGSPPTTTGPTATALRCTAAWPTWRWRCPGAAPRRCAHRPRPTRRGRLAR